MQDKRIGLKAATEGNVIFPNDVFGLVITSLYWIKIRVSEKGASAPYSHIAKISVTSPIAINMPTRELLAGETKSSFV